MENESENGVRSMYLSTLPNKKKIFVYDRCCLDVKDIKGTQCKFLEKPIIPRQIFYDKNFDIEKSRSRELIPSVVNRVNTSLEVDDIAGTFSIRIFVGTRTKINKFVTTRSTNPLNPHYQTSIVKFHPFEEPKFIRDNMQIDDIEGVRTKDTFVRKMERANITIDNKKELIMTIKPKYQGFIRKDHVNMLMDVSDINLKGVPIARETNPLEPIYTIESQNGPVQYGKIELSHAKESHKAQHPTYSLSTNDIEGAQPKKNNFVMPCKEIISGTQPQSLKKGIVSKRATNPLQPSYNYLGTSQQPQKVRPASVARPKTAVQRFDAFLI